MVLLFLVYLFGCESQFSAERFGSGDGEREASMTRQMPYEPLPASVLLGDSFDGVM